MRVLFAYKWVLLEDLRHRFKHVEKIDCFSLRWFFQRALFHSRMPCLFYQPHNMVNQKPGRLGLLPTKHTQADREGPQAKFCSRQMLLWLDTQLHSHTTKEGR